MCNEPSEKKEGYAWKHTQGEGVCTKCTIIMMKAVIFFSGLVADTLENRVGKSCLMIYN